MPYRRLPNTDMARARAIKTMLQEQEYRHELTEDELPYSLLYQVRLYLQNYEKRIETYRESLKAQVQGSKSFQHESKMARLYVSHFIQVLNLAVIRGDIKKDKKQYYGIEEDDYSVPDLGKDSALLKWGKAIVEGERKRIAAGGTPIYNPSIQQVNVYFDIFSDHAVMQQRYQRSTTEALKDVSCMREEGDEMILQLWNVIENHFSGLPPYKRLCACQRYGVVYYYRRHEPELTAADDEKWLREKEAIEKAERDQLKLPLENG